MVNPLLIPSRSWNAVKRVGLILCCTIFGSMLAEGFAGNPAFEKPVRVNTAQVNSSGGNTAVQMPEGKLVLVPPGTIVSKSAPRGWSHLVLKSLPRISPKHQALVSATAYELSRLVFTSIVARVEQIPQSNPPRYVLGDIGLGLGTTVQGRDMVLSPETQARLGANLGFQERIVLSECYKRQAMARSVVRTPTMAVFDTHAVMIREGQHRLSRVRYAVLLDPRSGQIATLCWGVALDQQGRPRAATTALEWLPPNKLADLVLYVDPRHITLTIPDDLAFAVDRAPQGHARIPLTNDLAISAGRAVYTAQSAGELESALRTELQRIIQRTARRDSTNRVASGSPQR